MDLYFTAFATPLSPLRLKYIYFFSLIVFQS